MAPIVQGTKNPKLHLGTQRVKDQTIQLLINNNNCIFAHLEHSAAGRKNHFFQYTQTASCSWVIYVVNNYALPNYYIVHGNS